MGAHKRLQMGRIHLFLCCWGWSFRSAEVCAHERLCVVDWHMHCCCMERTFRSIEVGAHERVRMGWTYMQSCCFFWTLRIAEVGALPRLPLVATQLAECASHSVCLARGDKKTTTWQTRIAQLKNKKVWNCSLFVQERECRKCRAKTTQPKFSSFLPRSWMIIAG